MASLANLESPINCILVNSNLSQEEQNFHGMHEFIHIALDNGNGGHTFKCYDRVKPFQNSYVEWLANEGAAELILPHDVLLPYIKEKIKTFDDNILGVYNLVYEIACIYKVSPVVVQNRLNSLRYEIYQYLYGCDINNIKIISKTQQKKLGIEIDSLNDIENRRLTETWLNSDKSVIVKPFFSYSKSYKNLSAI